jgi:hypothetical protein
MANDCYVSVCDDDGERAMAGIPQASRRSERWLDVPVR